MRVGTVCFWLFLALCAFIIYNIFRNLAIAFDLQLAPYNECPNRTILTVQTGGNTANRILEYLSVLTISAMHPELFRGYVPDDIHKEMSDIFETLSLRAISTIPAYCYKAQQPLIIAKTTPGDEIISIAQRNNTPFMQLDMYSARYPEILRYGLQNVRSSLKFKSNNVNVVQHLFHSIRREFAEFKDPIFVGVHYRGTDYAHHLDVEYNIHLDSKHITAYYRKAMAYIQRKHKEVIFMVISADHAWIDENSKVWQEFASVINPKTVLEESVGERGAMVSDLTTLALCNGSIINYGTFGAFAALYNGGETVVFDLGLPLDFRGTTLAMALAAELENWHVMH